MAWVVELFLALGRRGVWGLSWKIERGVRKGLGFGYEYGDGVVFAIGECCYW